LHSFGGPAEGDGAYPQGSLFLSDDGSILYGMTTLGGANNKGTLFSIPITGGSNTILHSFAGEPSDGRYPYYTRIILSGSMLYGMTEFGGANNKGVICKIKTDGTEYSAVYSFGSIDNDGSKPCGDLIQYKNLLYGMALEGGEYNKGTIFYYVSGMAEVETGAVTNVETTTATGNGNITSLGSSNPTQHGVCWGTSHNPTIDDDHTEDGTVSETGAFTSSITGLTEGTTYYVRAYATNTEGISYGDEVSFTTSTSTSTALYLAEGCTNGFTEYILIQNPSDTTATITVTFMDDSGTKTPTTFSVNPYSRYTLNANNIVSNKSVGAKIESTVNTVSVERAMYWPVADRNGTGGHCSKAISAAATTWYFAEGCTQGFDEWMLILNPSETETAQVTVNFYDNAGNTTPASFTVSPHSRYTLHANDVISGTSTSAVIESTNSVSIVAERSMYWNSDNSIWTDGTCSFGSSSLATDWYFSEGCTDGFTEWILIYNPNGSSIDIAVTFYDESGNQATVPITVGANARYTLNVNNAINANKSISAKLHSTSQFTAERAMYWDSNSIASIGGHCSGGTATPSTNWYFAEGCTKGFDEYLVLFNPNTAAATVTITTMDSDGNTESFNYTVAGNSRKTIVVNSFYHGNKDVSLYITSTQTIVAERSMYWEDGSSSWTGGTCDLGKEVVIS